MKGDANKEKKTTRVACPFCGTMNTTDFLEPRMICSFCGNTIVIGEKSGL